MTAAGTSITRSTALRWGIIGTGGIAGRFVADVGLLPGAEVVAVGSRTPERAAGFGGRFGIGRAHGTYAELVDDPQVDAVYVATPHPFHAEHALLAIGAGKAVLVEKPFTMDAAQARAVAEAARAAGVFAMEAMWSRFNPHLVRVREVLASGALGEITTVTADHGQYFAFDPSHRLFAPELGGGALLDLGIYPVSFAWDILGAPTSITASAQLIETGVDSEVATTFTHANGAVSTTISAARSAGPNTAHILGTKARIDIDRTWYNPTTFRVVAPDGTVLEEYVSHNEGRGMQFQAIAAERFIAEGKTDSDLLGIDETVAIMQTLDDIRALIGVRYPQEG